MRALEITTCDRGAVGGVFVQETGTEKKTQKQGTHALTGPTIHGVVTDNILLNFE